MLESSRSITMILQQAVIRVSRGAKLSNLLTLGAYRVCPRLPSGSSSLVLVVGFSAESPALVSVPVHLAVAHLAKSSSSSKHPAKYYSL